MKSCKFYVEFMKDGRLSVLKAPFNIPQNIFAILTPENDGVEKTGIYKGRTTAVEFKESDSGPLFTYTIMISEYEEIKRTEDIDSLNSFLYKGEMIVKKPHKSIFETIREARQSLSLKQNQKL